MAAYYNEFDPFAAAWLRELIKDGHIPDGDVDERSIVDVSPEDVRGYTQQHYFAGIGGWSLALRMIGWDDELPITTGSCPCQPFSAAGKQKGFDDERHLWPDFYRLIAACRPAICCGEQVASKDGLAWLDLVYSDLEAAGYAVRTADLCSASVGAPHVRQRLYWMGNAKSLGCQGRQPVPRSGARRVDGRAGTIDGPADTQNLGRPAGRPGQPDGSPIKSCRPGNADGLADADHQLLQRCGPRWSRGHSKLADHGGHVGLADAGGTGLALWRGERIDDEQERQTAQRDRGGEPTGSGPTNGFWRDADWLLCRDGKWRAAEPGSFPLASGFPNRVGLLRGAGNAITVQTAAEFLRACLTP